MNEPKQPAPPVIVSPSDPPSNAVHQLALFIFKLGRDVERLTIMSEERVTLAAALAWDKGFVAGRDSVEAELGLDGMAVLKTKPSGGTGAPAAN